MGERWDGKKKENEDEQNEDRFGSSTDSELCHLGNALKVLFWFSCFQKSTISTATDYSTSKVRETIRVDASPRNSTQPGVLLVFCTQTLLSPERKCGQ